MIPIKDKYKSLCFNIYLSIYLSIYLCLYSLYISPLFLSHLFCIYLSIYLSINVSRFLSIYFFVSFKLFPSLYLCQSFHSHLLFCQNLSIYLSIYVCIDFFLHVLVRSHYFTYYRPTNLRKIPLYNNVFTRPIDASVSSLLSLHMRKSYRKWNFADN